MATQTSATPLPAARPAGIPQRRPIAATDFGGDVRLSWAAGRLEQKLQAIDERAHPPSRLGYLGPAAPILASLGAVCLALGLSTWIAFRPAQIALLALGATLGVAGLGALARDLSALLRHAASSAESTARTFFRAVLRGSYGVAYRLLLPKDRDGLVRQVPQVPGMRAPHDVPLTFDTSIGFRAYWEEAASRGRPTRWDDSYAVFSEPLRWHRFERLRVHRLDDGLSIVAGELVLHFLPRWVLVMLLFGLLPGLVLAPMHHKTVRLKVRKAVARSRDGWRIVNGELISAEDLAGWQLAQETAN